VGKQAHRQPQQIPHEVRALDEISSLSLQISANRCN
jgi:hypothetical protein